MYLRAAHVEFDIPSLRKFIVDNPLGLLVSALQPSSFAQIQCTHMPWVLDVKDDASTTELGRLRGHMARANPHTKALIEAAERKDSTNVTLDGEVSVMFNGPVHSYVTPKFYVQTKPDTGKVVPTWNYSAVQVYGRAKILCDSRSEETRSFLQKQVTDLTKHSEEHLMNYRGGDRPDAWKVSDAPASYVELLKKGIIGIEITIDRLEGKWKMSQEMGEQDNKGVVEGFAALGTDAGLVMSKTVQERAAKKAAAKNAPVK